jgi:DNA-binding MarR family transcriptional regulator
MMNDGTATPLPDAAGADEAALLTELRLLDAVASDERLTQRSLAKRLGMALGLANAVVRRCVKKGLIKVAEAPPRRFIYYLTPHGFAEKSRLTAEFLGYSLGFFRQARAEYAEIFALCEARGWTRIALCGVGELCEIASLAARDRNVTLVAVIDRDHPGETFGGLSVQRRARGLAVDAVVVTDRIAPQVTFDGLVRTMAPDRVLAPRILRVAPRSATGPTL